KSYDLVRWKFVDHVLEKLGFRRVWRGWTRYAKDYKNVNTNKRISDQTVQDGKGFATRRAYIFIPVCICHGGFQHGCKKSYEKELSGRIG
ncbi:hypothetical protein PIB30_058886, partial [Stylosanthes scabra]|nr:hypothetical protein [Stylosanthes scabra]